MVVTYRIEVDDSDPTQGSVSRVSVFCNNFVIDAFATASVELSLERIGLAIVASMAKKLDVVKKRRTTHE